MTDTVHACELLRIRSGRQLMSRLCSQEKVQSCDFIREHLMGLLRSKTPGMKQRIATNLVHLLAPDDIARAYGAHGGARVLLDMVCDDDLALGRPREWLSALQALREVVRICQERELQRSTSFVPAPPDEQVRHACVYMSRHGT
jgi:hypothetical protein